MNKIMTALGLILIGIPQTVSAFYVPMAHTESFWESYMPNTGLMLGILVGALLVKVFSLLNEEDEEEYKEQEILKRKVKILTGIVLRMKKEKTKR